MQVPAPFDYRRASSVDDALRLLRELGPEARLVAGGHSLIPMMKLRLAAPEFVIDVNDLTDLAYVRRVGDDIRIGALARHRDLLESPLVREYFPIVTDAEALVADPLVRNRGTVGGSLCQADPSEDLSAVCAAVGAQIVIRGAEGERVVTMAEFHRGPYETACAQDEIVTEIRLPIRPGAGSAYEKLERRAGDWAVAAAGAAVWAEDGCIVDCGIALCAVGAHEVASTRAQDHLRGAAPTRARIVEAAALAAEDTTPFSDQRGPAEYKQHLARELSTRALLRACARAGLTIEGTP
jgi:carbon-monoxide dehydrogenase medium subunit